MTTTYRVVVEETIRREFHFRGPDGLSEEETSSLELVQYLGADSGRNELSVQSTAMRVLNFQPIATDATAED